MRGSAGPLPRECPAWVRACHSWLEFGLRPGTLSSRRSPGRESEDAPGLRDVPEPKSPGKGGSRVPRAAARTYQMKSVQWLQKRYLIRAETLRFQLLWQPRSDP
ncbi:uncharacterized protein LOC143442630 [Arvicanthis niloticus]|uniref:uncharacterized protein LOC143312858 n=1 Tax=Arvicanthis niloticus TaxID=61156 RepID=UPI00402B2B78